MSINFDHLTFLNMVRNAARTSHRSPNYLQILAELDEKVDTVLFKIRLHLDDSGVAMLEGDEETMYR